VTRKRLGRLATLFTAAMTASMLLGVGAVSAANPSWDIITTPTPAKVGAGHDAGFIVTVVNNGPSNINDLRVTLTTKDTPTAAPTHVSSLVYRIDGELTGETATCAPAGVPLTCLIGTLEDDESVTFTVAYFVPLGTTGAFDLNVAIRAGTGDVDGGNNSRGDKYDENAAATIGSGNFDGGFVVGAETYQTNPSLGNRNIQSTALTGVEQLVPVMIEDGIPSDTRCDSVLDDPDCGSLFGEWSLLNVNNGNGGEPFADAFKVTLKVRGGPSSSADVQVVHILDDGTIDVISLDCTYDSEGAPTNAECLTAVKNGNVWTIDVWLLSNGSIRGGI
jgi:hypothetical protein